MHMQQFTKHGGFGTHLLCTSKMFGPLYMSAFSKLLVTVFLACFSCIIVSWYPNLVPKPPWKPYQKGALQATKERSTAQAASLTQRPGSACCGCSNARPTCCGERPEAERQKTFSGPYQKGANNQNKVLRKLLQQLRFSRPVVLRPDTLHLVAS